MDPRPLQLPGYGLSLNIIPPELFPTGLDVIYMAMTRRMMPLLSIREHTMLHLMNSITDKPAWNRKVFNRAITDKWKNEASSSGKDITFPMIDWVIQELQHKAHLWEHSQAVTALGGDVAVKCDNFGHSGLVDSLRAAVSQLEDSIPVSRKDYHPGSDGKVVDLVHPSLYPLVYGRTRIFPQHPIDLSDCLEHIGKGEIIPIPPESETMATSVHVQVEQASHQHGAPATPYSQNFQWLPCDVQVFDGNICRIASYINNLHPEDHYDLYECIEQILSRVIPLWNTTLTPLRTGDWYRRIHPTSWEYEGTLRDPAHDLEEPIWRTSDLHQERHRVLKKHGSLDQYDRRKWKAVQPEVGQFHPYIYDQEVNLCKDFRKQGLQVIVKLANIELTPEKPEYAGGSWHVEGQLNEHICATAIYYYSNENITESRLSFRQITSTTRDGTGSYHQDQHGFLEDIYGLGQGRSTVQELGSVLCKEDRLITFPNILQHRVEPFRLQDSTRPGHRKIVALFLVDPNIRIISTAHVPPQQKEWFEKRLLRQSLEDGLGRLPAELVSQVVDMTSGFIKGDEAQTIRLTLMEERRELSVIQGSAFEETITFSLCEH